MLAVDVGENRVVPPRPLGEAGDVLPDALAIGVEQVGAVLADTEARFVVDEVVAVARDVVAAVDHENLVTCRQIGQGRPGALLMGESRTDPR